MERFVRDHWSAPMVGVLSVDHAVDCVASLGVAYIAVALNVASLSLGALVGSVTVFGITSRNAIMLISHSEHVVTEEGAARGSATALRGAAERLGPILMTALVTGLGLLPLAIGAFDPGKKNDGPLAIVILGGRVTSTALRLFMLPTRALRFGQFGSPAATTLVDSDTMIRT